MRHCSNHENVSQHSTCYSTLLDASLNVKLVFMKFILPIIFPCLFVLFVYIRFHYYFFYFLLMRKVVFIVRKELFQTLCDKLRFQFLNKSLNCRLEIAEKMSHILVQNWKSHKQFFFLLFFLFSFLSSSSSFSSFLSFQILLLFFRF